MTLAEQIQRSGVAVSPQALEEIVRQVVEAVQPEKIILFGSAARGSAGPGSDLDLLVVKSGDYHHIELAQRIYMAIHAPKFAIDVTVATPEEVERYRDDFCLVLYPALREGKVVYDAHAA